MHQQSADGEIVPLLSYLYYLTCTQLSIMCPYKYQVCMHERRTKVRDTRARRMILLQVCSWCLKCVSFWYHVMAALKHMCAAIRLLSSSTAPVVWARSDEGEKGFKDAPSLSLCYESKYELLLLLVRCYYEYSTYSAPLASGYSPNAPCRLDAVNRIRSVIRYTYWTGLRWAKTYEYAGRWQMAARQRNN
ncbi:hypothetical protein V8C37DRAFT_17027 [Trichoderma ceciliae]